MTWPARFKRNPTHNKTYFSGIVAPFRSYTSLSSPCSLSHNSCANIYEDGRTSSLVEVDDVSSSNTSVTTTDKGHESLTTRTTTTTPTAHVDSIVVVDCSRPAAEVEFPPPADGSRQGLSALTVGQDETHRQSFDYYWKEDEEEEEDHRNSRGRDFWIHLMGVYNSSRVLRISLAMLVVSLSVVITGLSVSWWRLMLQFKQLSKIDKELNGIKESNATVNKITTETNTMAHVDSEVPKTITMETRGHLNNSSSPINGVRRGHTGSQAPAVITEYIGEVLIGVGIVMTLMSSIYCYEKYVTASRKILCANNHRINDHPLPDPRLACI